MSGSSGHKAIVIGASAGGLNALTQVLSKLPANYPIPVVIVQHRSKDERGLLEEILQEKCSIRVQQANEKEAIVGGVVYVAPPDYHLLVERDMTFSLTTDEKVNFSRPSIDVLFETAAEVYRSRLIGIVLTGANSDGRRGTETIHRYGGMIIAQDPAEAEFPAMPQAAIASGVVSKVLLLKDISSLLLTLE